MYEAVVYFSDTGLFPELVALGRLIALCTVRLHSSFDQQGGNSTVFSWGNASELTSCSENQPICQKYRIAFVK